MSETAEQQRQRLERKRITESDEPLIQCLECPLYFKRVGSHVVQIHGYENTREYRRAHGLMARETHTIGHVLDMRAKVKTLENLEKGAANRFKKGGDHGRNNIEFWDNREKMLGTRKRIIIKKEDI